MAWMTWDRGMGLHEDEQNDGQSTWNYFSYIMLRKTNLLGRMFELKLK